MRGNNESQMRRRRKAAADWLLRRWMTVYPAAGRPCRRRCPGWGRTAPVGCVGWRFHRDSLGSHACLHLYGPKKPSEDPPSLTTPNSITWVCGAAKFTLKQVQREGGGGFIPLNYLILTQISLFSQWSPVMSNMWRSYSQFTWQRDWS